jgi:hypothetical protein
MEQGQIFKIKKGTVADGRNGRFSFKKDVEAVFVMVLPSKKIGVRFNNRQLILHV